MQRVGTRFARHIQRNLSTTGHLFENRYHAVLVDVDRYFLQLLRYIHLNPVRAGIVEQPHQYRWSSHRVYLGKVSQPWIHTDFGLRLFSADEDRARTLYRDFIESPSSESVSPLAEIHSREPRVLGDDRFLEQLAVPRSRKPPLRTLDAMIAEICAKAGVSVDSVRSQSRCRNLSRLRAHIAKQAIDEQVATLSEIARHFHRSASAMSRAIMRYHGA